MRKLTFIITLIVLAFLAQCSGIRAQSVVQLSHFTARAADCGVQFEWSALNELGMVNYDIEYSNDGKTFIHIMSVPAGAENFEYSAFWDAKGNEAGLFRLRFMTGNAETIVYSDILRVKMSCKETRMLYPNPVDDRLYVNKFSSDSFTMQFFNAGGSQVHAVNARGNSYAADVSSLPPGTYLVRVLEGANIIATEKLLKR